MINSKVIKELRYNLKKGERDKVESLKVLKRTYRKWLKENDLKWNEDIGSIELNNVEDGWNLFSKVVKEKINNGDSIKERIIMIKGIMEGCEVLRSGRDMFENKECNIFNNVIDVWNCNVLEELKEVIKILNEEN